MIVSARMVSVLFMIFVGFACQPDSGSNTENKTSTGNKTSAQTTIPNDTKNASDCANLWGERVKRYPVGSLVQYKLKMSVHVGPSQTSSLNEFSIQRTVTQSDLNTIVLGSEQTQEPKSDFMERCTKWGSVVSMTLSPPFVSYDGMNMPIDGLFSPVPGLDVKVEQTEESITVAAGSYKTIHTKWSMAQNIGNQTTTIDLDLWTQGAGANILMIKSKLESKMADPGRVTGNIFEWELTAE